MELMFVWTYMCFYHSGGSTEGWGNAGNLHKNDHH